MQSLTDLPEEARTIINRAARLYQRFLGPDITCLYLDGPAVSGGVIPGFSVLTFWVVIREPGLECEAPPSDTAILLQRELSRLDIGPFGSIRTIYVPDRHEYTWYPPAPDSYLVLAGAMPGPDATEAELLDRSRTLVSSLETRKRLFGNSLALFDTAESLSRARMCVDHLFSLFPAMIVAVQGNVLAVWAMPVPAQIQELERIAPDLPVRPFLLALARAGVQRDIDSHLTVIEQGILLLDACETWYASRQLH